MNDRVQRLNDRDFRRNAKYILYWTQMNRRAESNHALEHAISLANEHGLPVLCYEGLTCTYPYANDRIHTFMLEAVPETRRRMEARQVGYCFYLRRRRADANDILYQVARDAAAVVTDDYPTFIPSEHNRSVPAKLDIPFIAVDSSCVVPMSRMEKREYAAYTIRPKIHKLLPKYLTPVERVEVKVPWQGTTPAFHVEVTDENIGSLVASCEIDHSVPPSTSFRGGRKVAEKRLRQFLKDNLRRYPNERNDPAAHATSELSPYLHFGHISSLEMALAAQDYAADNDFGAAEFLEELIVRRELAFNYARYCRNHNSFEALPDWARKTIEEHDKDPRDPQYTPEQMEQAETYDDIWNATQKELLLRGKIHGYYRMYWGKKIMEWSKDHKAALDLMIRLHDKYALDGRDPNTYTNILWCFGLHDRPWSTRPIFGTLRYMSYDGMKRKTNSKGYIREIQYLEQTRKDPYRVE